MPTIGFWNLNGKSDLPLISRFVEENGVEILVVAEQAFDANELIFEYTAVTRQALYHITPLSGVARVNFYSVFPPETFHYRVENAYVGFVEYIPIRGDSLLIAGAHLPSKLNLRNSSSQLIEAQRVRSQIEELEKSQNHSRTIVVGDLNMNPFEDGMIATNGFHGVMDRRIARKEQRTVLHNAYSYFYNPMWKLMGDSNSSALGTYFKGSGEHFWYFWNTLDHVLLRPALLGAFHDQDLRIVEAIGGRSLLAKNGAGLNRSISDHLPIVFKLET